jgi:hypothetical protein
MMFQHVNFYSNITCEFLKMTCNALGQKLKKLHNYKKRKNADSRRQMQHCPLFRKKVWIKNVSVYEETLLSQCNLGVSIKHFTL